MRRFSFICLTIQPIIAESMMPAYRRIIIPAKAISHTPGQATTAHRNVNNLCTSVWCTVSNTVALQNDGRTAMAFRHHFYYLARSLRRCISALTPLL